MAEQEERIRYQARIHDLPSGDRPRERLRDAGPTALSNSELLAILLRTRALPNKHQVGIGVTSTEDHLGTASG